MSVVRANTYQDASGGSNAVFSGVASPPNSMGFRNRILNGNMVIDQRNAGASVTSGFPVDRFGLLLAQASKLTAQQNAGSVTPPAGFNNYLGITSSSAYSVLTGDFFALYQRIEGFNAADLAWGSANAQAVTLSFWVRSSLTGTFGGAFRNDAGNRSYPFTYTISAANTWEQKSITVAGDTSGTWLKTNGMGIEIDFSLGMGSTFSGTAGAWAAGNFLSATGATSVVGTNGATFYITGVQLEAGTNASAFEQIDYGRELALCQRYFCMTFSQGTAPASNAGQGGALLTLNGSGTAVGVGLIVTWNFPAEMRTGPSVVTTYNPSAAGSSWYLSTAATVAAATSNPGTRAVTIYNNATSTSGTNAAIHVTASAEL
jgi:hypothetical protein